ncbi:MAG: MarR family transcriptional regulator [Phycisphaerales bacterium]
MQAESRTKIEDERRDRASRLHVAALRLLRRLRSEDDALDISPARLSVLSILVFGGASTPGELARLENVTRPTMTGLLAGLEQDGFVRRLSNPEDRRSVTVRATKAGVALLHRGRDRRVETLAQLLDSLAESDRRTLDQAARIINDRLLRQSK